SVAERREQRATKQEDGRQVSGKGSRTGAVRVMRKQLPPPATGTYSSAAWLASHICRARYRPRPVPYWWVVKKGSKIWAATLGGMPGPRSITSISGGPS